MSNPEVSKQQALRALETTIFVLGQAIESCCIAESAPDIPKAFSIVAKHLPIVEQVFSSARNHLKSSKEETEQLKELYPVVKHVSDEGCGQLRSIENLFDTVTQDGEKMERYASAVKSGDGKKVETIMVELLTNASLVAVDPLVSQDNIETLQRALEEVKKLPPSLEEDRSAGVVLNNSGSGNQFYHGGRGNQNHCSGGFQVNGDNQNASSVCIIFQHPKGEWITTSVLNRGTPIWYRDHFHPLEPLPQSMHVYHFDESCDDSTPIRLLVGYSAYTLEPVLASADATRLDMYSDVDDLSRLELEVPSEGNLSPSEVILHHALTVPGNLRAVKHLLIEEAWEQAFADGDITVEYA
ncbi:hypothetical protein AU210_001879 [Fusarium oxysporum f. sp. radicis-cucumerinum]|uniref:NACHT-NTPase and P-loop NTPases N-terminal domain-containing protein n=1 Tax=Fusarium oxysporum f. sp. radicis-cucumerinum TaxID=327505 RepID=A0A2H3I8K5_FUSOX|nr:hypothetical protein AU210_001879 [Fusarium oxysporum f. sp. radicis-cucumerinum]